MAVMRLCCSPTKLTFWPPARCTLSEALFRIQVPTAVVMITPIMSSSTDSDVDQVQSQRDRLCSSGVAKFCKTGRYACMRSGYDWTQRQLCLVPAHCSSLAWTWFRYFYTDGTDRPKPVILNDTIRLTHRSGVPAGRVLDVRFGHSI